MDLAPAASAPAVAAARSPQRGNWPYVINPPARTSEAAYKQLMANVPDRTLPRSQSFLDKGVQAASATAGSLGKTSRLK